MVDFGNTDFTNSGFGQPQPQNNVPVNPSYQMVSGQTVNPSNVDFHKKPHNEQPKEFTKNPIGEFGQDFPKVPDFHLGGSYDWNFYPKLINKDLDGKLEILRKVGV